MKRMLALGVALAICSVYTISCSKKNNQSKNNGKPPVSVGTGPGTPATTPTATPPGTNAPANPPASTATPPKNGQTLKAEDLHGVWSTKCVSHYPDYKPFIAKYVLYKDEADAIHKGYYRMNYFNDDDCNTNSFDRAWVSNEFSYALGADISDNPGFKEINYTYISTGYIEYNIVGIFDGSFGSRLYDGDLEHAGSDGVIRDGSSPEMRPTKVDYLIEFVRPKN